MRCSRLILVAVVGSSRTEHGHPQTAWRRSTAISSKPTSRPRSCEFGLDLTSGLPVTRAQSRQGQGMPHLNATSSSDRGARTRNYRDARAVPIPGLLPQATASFRAGLVRNCPRCVRLGHSRLRVPTHGYRLVKQSVRNHAEHQQQFFVAAGGRGKQVALNYGCTGSPKP